MKYVVYCDESRHSDDCASRFMGIGGLWVPQDIKPQLTKKFSLLKRSLNLNAEVKWEKVSRARLAAYQSIADFFISEESLQFRIILVEHDRVNMGKHHGNDKELGFYKFYFEMLEKWMVEDNEYLVLLDFKQNKGADRYRVLRQVLERATMGRAWVSDLTVINSQETPLAQLCDVLTGAVTASACGIAKDSAKAEMARYLADRLGTEALHSPSPGPAISKFNVFRIRL